MNNSTKRNSHQTSELVAYHKVKRKFLSLMDMEKDGSDQLVLCEFTGEDFELLAG